MIFDVKHETMSREEMQALQLARLKEIVKYAYDNVPFYKKKYDEAGFDPNSIETLDDLNKWFHSINERIGGLLKVLEKALASLTIKAQELTAKVEEGEK